MKTLLASLFAAGVTLSATAQEPATTLTLEHEQQFRHTMQQLMLEQAEALKQDTLEQMALQQAYFHAALREQLDIALAKADENTVRPAVNGTSE